MKIFPSSKLESIQAYDFLFCDRQIQDEDCDGFFCPYCHLVIVDDENDICNECQISLNELRHEQH